jgi:hypothetical protein
MVLVVVSVLTLGAYTFSEIMLSESEATAMFGRQAESRGFAYSGIEQVCAVLGYPESEADYNVYHNPPRYQAVPLRSSENARGRGYFSVVAPIESDPTASSLRFGLIDESGKLNINFLMTMEELLNSSDQASEGSAEPPESVRDRLLAIPNMSLEVADAILDWLDEDSIPREYGVESDYYQSLAPPYQARDGAIESIHELLQIAGVTPELLYGEDQNRNGLLDPGENDGSVTKPLDDADGVLDIGWTAFFTVESKEVNKRSDGSEYISLSNGSVGSKDLWYALSDEYGDDVADYVVALRIWGTPDNPTGPARPIPPTPQGETISSPTGLDLDYTPAFTIDSIYRLFIYPETAPAKYINGMDDRPITNPWNLDVSELQSILPRVFDALTTYEDDEILGRVNINQARYEVLLAIPGMTEEIAEAITSSSMIGSDTGVSEEQQSIRSTTGWLVTQGIVDLPTMVDLDRFLTAKGSVYRAQVVGYFEQGGGYTRLEAVLDATQSPVKILRVSDLTELGRGYRQDMLTGTVAEN